MENNKKPLYVLGVDKFSRSKDRKGVFTEKERMLTNNEDLYNVIYGNLEWKDGVIDSEVIFKEYKK